MNRNIVETDKEVAQQASGYRFVILGLLAALAFSTGLNIFAIGPIMPLVMDNYQISYGVASLLMSIVWISHLLAIPLSLLVGRVGLKKIILVGAIANAAPVLSFMAVDNFPFLMILRAIHGTAIILTVTGSAPLFMQWFRPKERAFANGTFVVSVTVGTTISSFLTAPLSEAIGWAETLSIFGGVATLSAVAWLILGRVQQTARRARSESILARTWRCVHSRSTLLIAGADAGPLALLTVVLAWLPTFYNEVHGISLIRSGFIMGLYSFAGLVSMVIATFMTMRSPRRKPFLVIPGILLGFSAFGSFLLADSVAVYVAVAILGVANWAYLPTLLTIPMDLYPDDSDLVSLIFGTLLTTGAIFGAVAPLLVGFIADATGSFLPGLSLFSFLSWSLLVSGLLLPETGPAAKAMEPEH